MDGYDEWLVEREPVLDAIAPCLETHARVPHKILYCAVLVQPAAVALVQLQRQVPARMSAGWSPSFVLVESLV